MRCLQSTDGGEDDGGLDAELVASAVAYATRCRAALRQLNEAPAPTTPTTPLWMQRLYTTAPLRPEARLPEARPRRAATSLF